MTWDPELLTGLGAALSIFLSASGSAIASAHSGVFAIKQKDFKSFVPIIISGVLGIYGIIVSVLLVGKFSTAEDASITVEDGYRNLSAGLAVGLACASSGFGISIFMQHLNQSHHDGSGARIISCNTGNSSSSNDALTTPLMGQRTTTTATTSVGGSGEFVPMVLCLCFLEAIGLYGLIVALFLMG